MPRLIRSGSIILLLCVLANVSLAAVPPQRIVTASNVRMRSEPTTKAPEVTKLAFGTLAEEIGKSPQLETINQIQEYWYHLRLPDGTQGWVFGGLTRPFDFNARETIFREMVAARVQNENLNLGECIELYRFVERVIADVSDPAIAVELKFAQLRALQRSVMRFEQTPALDEWVKEQQANLVYGEPQGMWLVQSELFWQLAIEYQDMPVADDIAWAAAQNTLPGECEGDVTCTLSALNSTDGRYLLLYPAGRHVAETLTQLSETLQYLLSNPVSPGSLTVEDVQILQGQCVALRNTVSATSQPQTKDVLAQLDQLLKMSGK